MFGYEEISLNLVYPSIYFFTALILIGGYTFYVYKFTIPPIGKILKTFLISFRTLALLLVLFIFFEPSLSFTKKIIIEPANLIFLDNSRSIKIDDGTNRQENAREIINDFISNPFSEKDKYYLYGDKIREIQKDSLAKIDFDDAVTNIAEVFSFIKNEDENFASLVLVTDGVVTSGSKSINSAKNLVLPIFTLGLGDTSQINDVSIKRILNNDLLYAESPTTIEVAIWQSGFNGKNIVLSLKEDNNLIEQKNIKLSSTSIQNETLIYTPQSSGTKKLSVEISSLKAELSLANNQKVFYINVLSNKVKVLLLSGSPSSDFTFIKNALKKDTNLIVQSLISVSAAKFIESTTPNFIDSADIFYFIGFPSSETNTELLNHIAGRINNDNIPFFILFSDYTDLDKLNLIRQELPFSVSNNAGSSREVQPQIVETNRNNPIIQNNAVNIAEAWNNLPPVHQAPYVYNVKPGSEVIALCRVNNNVTNSPLLISRNFGNTRSITILASNIWKWKLQTVRDNNMVFDSFINNSLKWLNASDTYKRVKIKSLKKNYSVGELVEFSAEVYDESLNPVSNAYINVNINSSTDNYELNLLSKGNGIYEGGIRINTKDDFSFSGKATLDDKKLGIDGGVFNVGDVDIEMINPKMDVEFLNLLANGTNGGFAFAKDYKDLIAKIRSVNDKAVKEKIIISEFSLWSDKWLMVIVIFLFSIEWFLRKRAGML